MAVLATTNITLPNNIADGLWSKAITGSAVAALSGQEPQKFGTTTVMTLTGRPRAEYVGEGAAEVAAPPRPSAPRPSPRTRCRSRCGSTRRSSGPTRTTSSASSTPSPPRAAAALGRALDLGVFHGINPLAGTAIAGIVVGDRIGTTTNSVEIVTATLTTPDTVIERLPVWSSPTGSSPTASRSTRPTRGRSPPPATPTAGRSTPSSASGRTSPRSRVCSAYSLHHRVGSAGGVGEQQHQGHRRRLVGAPLGRAEVGAGRDDRVRRPGRAGRPEAERTRSPSGSRSSTAGASWTWTPSPRSRMRWRTSDEPLHQHPDRGRRIRGRLEGRPVQLRAVGVGGRRAEAEAHRARSRPRSRTSPTPTTADRGSVTWR